jgi:hypothetical protein
LKDILEIKKHIKTGLRVNLEALFSLVRETGLEPAHPCEL